MYNKKGAWHRPCPCELTTVYGFAVAVPAGSVLAGSGVWWSDACSELQSFIEKASLPLYTICLARGAVSDLHPLCFGYGDPALNRAANQAAQGIPWYRPDPVRFKYSRTYGAVHPNLSQAHEINI